MFERHLSPWARERTEAISNVAGRLSLPLAAGAMLCLYGHIWSAIWLFVLLWIAFGFAVAGAHLSTGDGRAVGRVTIFLLSVGAIFVYLASVPGVQQARE
jgi:hypothetical protein